MEKKRDWMKTSTLALCVILLAVNLWQGKRISELERSVWSVQNEVMSGVSRVESRLSSMSYDMEHADDVVLDWDYTTSVDMEKRRLNVEVNVELKEWSQDTLVKVAWENLYGEELEGFTTLTGNLRGGYHGTVELPGLEHLNEITLTALIMDGSTSRQESLGTLGWVSDLLPIRCYNYGFGGPVYEKDTNQTGRFLLSECEAELEGDALALDRVTEQVFRLTRNGKTVVEQAAKLEDVLDIYTCGELSAEVQTGDELLLTFRCRDGDGVGYEFFIGGWTVNEGGFTDNAPEWGYSRLFWN